MRDLTGRLLLGRYMVSAFVGRGGMAEVYKAWDERRSVHVALKVLNEDLAADYVFLRRFAREARALELLQHPNIIRFFGFEEHKDLAFLVMEHIDGSTLRRQLKLLGRPLTLPEALAVLRPVSSALHFAHQMGVYHCDVKPTNIFIERGGRVLLGDFGIARLTESATVTFSTPGTPAYMAPEQCRGREIDARTDVYSLAVTTYEMLTLDRPFKGDTQEATGSVGERVRWEQVHASPPLPSVVNPQISAGTDEAILKGLEKEPARRHQSVQEFYGALSREGAVEAAGEVAWAEREPDAEAVPPAAVAAPARRGLGLWFALGGVTVVVLAALVLMFLSGSGSAVPTSGAVPTLIETVSATSGIVLEPTSGSSPMPAGMEIAASDPSDTPTASPTETPRASPTDTPVPSPTHTPTIEPSATPTSRHPVDVGGRIVFTRKREASLHNTAEIWVLDLNTDSVSQLTSNNAIDWIPTWSPDGSRIAFTSKRQGNYDLWVMNADGSDQKPWITLHGWDEYARWSPNSSELAFASTDETDGVSNSEIFVAASNSSLRRLTFNKGADQWPSWSPDGRWIACSSDRDGDMDIYVFSAADGTQATNWTSDDASNERPAWSPDGEWIAFIRMAQTTSGEKALWGDLWIGRRDQSDFRRLTSDGLAIDPAWSPDGRYLVFSRPWDSTKDGELTTVDASDLWVISVEGDGPYRLTEGTEQDFAPQWAR